MHAFYVMGLCLIGHCGLLLGAAPSRVSHTLDCQTEDSQTLDPQTVATKTSSDIPSFVGKRLPYLHVSQWYVNGPLSVATLEGKPWVFVLVRFASSRIQEFLPVLESIHRPLEEGGPCVLAFSKDYVRDLEYALRNLGKKPSFYIARDRQFRTHLKLKVDVFPYFYLIDGTRKVVWQGTAGPELFEKLKELTGKQLEPKPVAGKPHAGPGASKGQEPGRLPKGFRMQVDKAMRKENIPLMVDLLRSTYKGTLAPKIPVLARLWEQLREHLDQGKARVGKRIAAKRYIPARELCAKLQRDFGEFPPAVELQKSWEQLAELEGKRWYERAEKALQDSDRETARRNLERLKKTYPKSQWAKKARVLLKQIKEID